MCDHPHATLGYLATEPIVLAISLWIGAAWATLFLFVNSAGLIFAQYGFDIGEQSSTLWSIGIGATIAFVINMHQEKLYHRAVERSPSGKAEPEARLHWACIGAFLFPLGVFIYAWTGRPHIHWIAPTLALVLVNIGLFLMCT